MLPVDTPEFIRAKETAKNASDVSLYSPFFVRTIIIENLNIYHLVFWQMIVLTLS